MEGGPSKTKPANSHPLNPNSQSRNGRANTEARFEKKNDEQIFEKKHKS